MRKHKKGILIGLILAFLLFLICAACIVYDGLHDHIIKADLIIVLGNKVNLDGKPSLQLKSRLDKTVELYKAGISKHILVSGGFGKEGFDEATVMADYLINFDIPREAITIDSSGIDTMSTAKNAKTLMQIQDLKSALIVTQYFHISRCKLALRKLGITNLGNAHAHYFSIRDFYSLPREVVGYAVYWCKSIE